MQFQTYKEAKNLSRGNDSKRSTETKMDEMIIVVITSLTTMMETKTNEEATFEPSFSPKL